MLWRLRASVSLQLASKISVKKKACLKRWKGRKVRCWVLFNVVSYDFSLHFTSDTRPLQSGHFHRNFPTRYKPDDHHNPGRWHQCPTSEAISGPPRRFRIWRNKKREMRYMPLSPSRKCCSLFSRPTQGPLADMDYALLFYNLRPSLKIENLHTGQI